ncbi:hypothetical protein DdX_15385 [Ditylenchus destructor]|uniref:Uncharacterized protein n=1 Tax=Ditylenchus destructor TaxID=166010 RepID=A0AAD4MSA9_9BILA|nr:hypothetical protein DdX_15385 [Ditylenchus destructor]
MNSKENGAGVQQAIDFMLSRINNSTPQANLVRIKEEMSANGNNLLNTPSPGKAFDFSSAISQNSGIVPSSPGAIGNMNNIGNDIWQSLSKANSMKEKKKFNTEVSDMLVIEVLKRKELLVENNTSRDLTFSENKRNAWNEVRRLLMERFPYFDLNVEAIKSHWRYRKRKVTDAYQDMKTDDFEASKVQGKISAVDFAIFEMLKVSSMLDKVKTETSTASPSEGEDGTQENYCDDPASVYSSSEVTQAMNAAVQRQFPFMVNNENGGTDPLQAWEKLAGMLWKLRQNNPGSGDSNINNTMGAGSRPPSQDRDTPLGNHGNDFTEKGFGNGEDCNNNDTRLNFTQLLATNVTNANPHFESPNNPLAQNGTSNNLDFTQRMASILNANSQLNKFTQNFMTTAASVSGSADPPFLSQNSNRRKRLRRSDAADELENRMNSAAPMGQSMEWSAMGSSNSGSMPNRVVSTSPDEAQSLEECQRMAYVAQKEAYTEMKSLISNIKTQVLPEFLLALQNFNKGQSIFPGEPKKPTDDGCKANGQQSTLQ